MNFEAMQKAWQSQDAGAKVTINADVLLKVVRRNQQQFRATIFWRDVREVGVAFLLTVFFFYHGLRHGNWTFCLLGFACFGVGAFMLVDRLLQRGKRPVAKDPLKTCIEGSLFQVNHQIWLLKNILWWYLSPFVAAWGISVGVSIWQLRHVGLSAVIGWGICILIYWGVYRLNQIAVRKDLEPRRQELEALLASLD